MRKTNQQLMPYVAAVEKYVSKKRVPFHMPGHKQGSGINPALRKLWGKKIFQYDLTEVDGLDYVNAPTGVIAEAEELAAQAFNTKGTFFLVNGSTLGNEAAIFSLVKEKEEILVSRNAHQSTSAGIILSGAVPIYAKPTLHEKSGFFPVTSESEVQRILAKHPNIKALHVTSPTHIGFTSGIKRIKELAVKHGIPLIVDEAHGSHFQFHQGVSMDTISEKEIAVIEWQLNNTPRKCLGWKTPLESLREILHTP